MLTNAFIRKFSETVFQKQLQQSLHNNSVIRAEQRGLQTARYSLSPNKTGFRFSRKRKAVTLHPATELLKRLKDNNVPLSIKIFDRYCEIRKYCTQQAGKPYLAPDISGRGSQKG